MENFYGGRKKVFFRDLSTGTGVLRRVRKKLRRRKGVRKLLY